MKKSLLSLLLLTGALSVSTLASCGETSSSVSSTGNTTSSSTSSSSSSSSSSTSANADAISEGTWDADAKVATGTYQYAAYGNKYGVKVLLTIDTTTNIITQATFKDSSEGAHNLTPSWGEGAGSAQKEDYDALNGNLAAYTNLNVWVAKGLTDGITEDSSKDSFLQIVAGATQTNGRFAKAVNLAVTSYIETAKVTKLGEIGYDTSYLPKDLGSYKKYTGEASYASQWGSGGYGSVVTVYVDSDNKIQYVQVEEPTTEGYHNMTPSWTADNKKDPVDAAATALSYYRSGKLLTEVLKGQAVADVQKALATLPELTANGDNVTTVGENTPTAYQVVTNATQTNGRNATALKKAVEQAVKAAAK